MRRILVLLVTLISASPVFGAKLNSVEAQALKFLEHDLPEFGWPFLERTVNINSGTLNPDGVCAVAEVYAAQFRRLGFKTSIINLASVHRGCHLLAERGSAKQSPRLLLIGHLDTVFEKNDPFQKLEISAHGKLHGPGVSDMKGGNLVMIEALRALNSTGALSEKTLSVFLTGDEETPGFDADGTVKTTRGPLMEIARHAESVFSFEPMKKTRQEAVIARRGYATWTLKVSAPAGHSSLIFAKKNGPGAIYAISLIIGRLYEGLHHEKPLSFNAGNIVGGTRVTRKPGEENIEATAAGKLNIIPAVAEVNGDMRTISDEQHQAVRKKMQNIVRETLVNLNVEYDKEAAATAEVSFHEDNGAMPPREGNLELLRHYNQVSLDLETGEIKGADPSTQGAGDISFVADLVHGALDGFGPAGYDYHTIGETTDKESIEIASRRATVMISRYPF